jgi:hypothetical protein
VGVHHHRTDDVRARHSIVSRSSGSRLPCPLHLTQHSSNFVCVSCPCEARFFVPAFVFFFLVSVPIFWVSRQCSLQGCTQGCAIVMDNINMYRDPSQRLSPALSPPYSTSDDPASSPAHHHLSQADLNAYSYSPSPSYLPASTSVSHDALVASGHPHLSSPLPIQGKYHYQVDDGSEAEQRISPSASTPPIAIPQSSDLSWDILASSSGPYYDGPHQQAYTPSYGSFQSSYAGSTFDSPLPPRLASPSFDQDLPPSHSLAESDPLFAAYDWREPPRHFGDPSFDDAYSSVSNADEQSSVSGYGSIYNTPAMVDDIEMGSEAERNLPTDMKGMAMFEPMENVVSSSVEPPERDDTLRPPATTTSASTAEKEPSILTGDVLSSSPQDTHARPALFGPASNVTTSDRPKDASPPLSKLQIPSMPHVAIQSATPTAVPQTARQNTAGTMEVERIFDSLVRNQEAIKQVDPVFFCFLFSPSVAVLSHFGNPLESYYHNEFSRRAVGCHYPPSLCWTGNVCSVPDHRFIQ